MYNLSKYCKAGISVLSISKATYLPTLSVANPYTGGATHPSISDIFLILPTYVNKLTGLRTSPYSILDSVIATTDNFLRGEISETQRNSLQGTWTFQESKDKDAKVGTDSEVDTDGKHDSSAKFEKEDGNANLEEGGSKTKKIKQSLWDKFKKYDCNGDLLFYPAPN